MKYFIGLDVGATKIEGVLTDQKARVISSEIIPTPKNRKDFLEAVFSLIKNLRQNKISGIGVGVPGQIIQGKIIHIPNLLKIRNFNLQKTVEKKFKTKTMTDNDANCFALAECFFRKKSNLVALTLGSGVGGGIIINKRIYHGSSNLSGEFGQIPYQNKTFEDYCSGKFFDKKSRSKKNYRQFGRHLGRLISLVANSYNPEIIVLGGSVSHSFDLFQKSMEKSFKSEITYPQLKKTKIIASKRNHAGAIGAALLPIHSNL